MAWRARSRTRRTTLLIGMATGITLCGMPATAFAAEEPNHPDNVIILISDGAGFNQFDAARLYSTGESYTQVAVDPATNSTGRPFGSIR